MLPLCTLPNIFAFLCDGSIKLRESQNEETPSLSVLGTTLQTRCDDVITPKVVVKSFVHDDESYRLTSKNGIWSPSIFNHVWLKIDDDQISLF